MKGPVLEARNLTISIPKGAGCPHPCQLRDVSLIAGPHELIAVISLDGGSQALLLKALSGQNQPSQGQVLIGDADLYKSRGAFRKEIGFVPRTAIVHMDLTVFEALYYSARLRMPKGTTRDARRQRIEAVLADLDLDALRDQRVKALDAEQRKRVSIGVELINNPGILLLDDPVNDLPPNKEVKLMHALRKLADQGLAMVFTTRSLSSMLLADQLAILLAGGYQAWFGPPEEALADLNSLPRIPKEGRSPDEEPGNSKLFNRRTTGNLRAGWTELFERLGSSTESEAQEWAERNRAQPATRRHLSASEQDKELGILLDERPLARMREKQVAEPARPTTQKVSPLGQLFALSGRNLKVLLRDRKSLGLILIVPLLAAMLDLVFSGRNMYDLLNGSSERILLSSSVLVFLVMLFAGFSWVREYRKEAVIIQREREAALKLLPYVLSKFWIVALFALYQAVVWTGVHFLIVDIPGGLTTPLYFFITLASVALVGGILGLLASALAHTEGGAGLLVFMLVLPQFLFSGGLKQIPELDPSLAALKWINPSRHAFEALVTAGGHGRALWQDGCLNQPEEARRAMSEAEKRQFCTCLGAGLFTKCNFPGIRRFYIPELDADPPVSPATFQDLLSLAQGKTEEQLRAEVEALSINLNHYMDLQIEWEAARSTAIGNAESLIKNEYDRFRDIFNVILPGHWAVLWISAVILLIIFSGVLVYSPSAR
jgi:ABC-type multidrug transport system ATPase subunit